MTHIKVMCLDDEYMNEIEFIAETEALCFAAPWGENDIKEYVIRDSGVCVLAYENGKPAGYALGSIAADEAELYRIAVLPELRGKHIGRRLLADFIRSCSEKGAKKIFLEVRSKNVPAIELYIGSGFEKISVRKRYYPDDDALIFLKKL